MWCFVCDAPLDGTVCPRCGRTGTAVEDAVEKESAPSPFAPLRNVPKWVWITLAAVIVIVLFTLMQSGFHLE
jgi:hypothetical protein